MKTLFKNNIGAKTHFPENITFEKFQFEKYLVTKNFGVKNFRWELYTENISHRNFLCLMYCIFQVLDKNLTRQFIAMQGQINNLKAQIDEEDEDIEGLQDVNKEQGCS